MVAACIKFHIYGMMPIGNVTDGLFFQKVR